MLLYFATQLGRIATCETSAADAFDFQQVADDVHGRDQVRENEPDVRRSSGED